MKAKSGIDILNHIEDAHTGEKKDYLSTLIRGIKNQKESKKKAILAEFESHLGES